MDIRAAINIVTETWAKKPDTTFWYDIQNDVLVDCRTFHHTEFAMMAPAKFRLTPEDLMQVAGFGGGDYDAFVEMMDETGRSHAYQPIIDAVIAQGFVRVVKEVYRWAGRERRALTLQGPERGCRKAVARFQADGFFPDEVITSGWKIQGDAIETFVKTGRIESDERHDGFAA